jgi:hypothetical protein
MREVFEAAIDAIFGDSNMAEDALWRAGGSDPAVPVRVIRRAPDAVVGFGDSRALLPSVLIDVRRSEIAEPAIGDAIENANDVFEVIAAPVLDSFGFVWTCEAAKQA